jgi:hypothetical protein
MPKKDTATAVLGMLSNVGAQTRPTASAPPVADPVETIPAAPAAQAPPSVEPPVDTRTSATVSTLPPAPAPANAVEAAPRTLRLRAETARALRDAWLEAKRDDVLLTAQDFASALVDEALTRRLRQRAARSG